MVVNPGPEMEQDYIESILGRESPVYYRDGQEKMGVLFQDTHRQYLSYGQIPREFVHAITAAEDKKFFSHFGIDIQGVTRAMIANVKAGRVVQGGSTISQQTAKNLFKRESRTIRAKLKELLYAFRLEYHYPKEKILEFYSNQFFVSGNGHGLGVAARYYFDKNASELSLLENAFIAGSVKRPNYYNPFTKKSKELSEKARKRAKKRAVYVLGRMYVDAMISEDRYNEALQTELEFRRGKMSFALNTIVDLVKDGLNSPVILDALEEHGISNVSTSGVRIITTVDKKLQDRSMYALRRNLARLDVRLRGYERDTVLAEYEKADFEEEIELMPGGFYFGTIVDVHKKGEKYPLIEVGLGAKRPNGLIDQEGLKRILLASARYHKNRWSDADGKDLKTLMKQFQKGDKIFVSVRSIDEDGSIVLDLERYPELQGGALVLQHGKIRAMVGGMQNRFYNRAVHAKRLMGSVFKPFLFAAALQLGWNSVDLLNNERNIFIFQDRPYFPRPDHISPHKEVSMSWAGTYSENLAAVWLVEHLTDFLTPPRLRELASPLDMAPRGDGDTTESYAHFRQRIRDDFGIVVNRNILQKAAFEKAILSLEADFLFDDRVHDYKLLQKLPYGYHFDRYLEDLLAVQKESKKKLSTREKKEYALREKILQKNYLALPESYNSLKAQQEYYINAVRQRLNILNIFREVKTGLPPDGYLFENEDGKIIYSLSLKHGEELQPLWVDDITNRLLFMSEAEEASFWENILLEGAISVYAYEAVTQQMALELEMLQEKRPYSMEVLTSIKDYRVMLGLQYLKDLGKEMGISSQLEPVLSFPLGSNVVSVLEAVRMYETLVSGVRYTPVKMDAVLDENDETLDGLAVIEKIETEDGKTIYSANQVLKPVLDQKTSVAVSNILENVILHGTGKYARKNVRFSSEEEEKNKALQKLDIPVPLLGKTGTANQFRNSSFFGFVPALGPGTETEMYIDNGFSVGVYVGFDDNRPMVKKTTRISGSGGALPIWSSIAEAVLLMDKSGDRVDEVDLSFNGLSLKYPNMGQIIVPVVPEKGGMVLQGSGNGPLVGRKLPKILSFGKFGAGGHYEGKRFFNPYWKNQQMLGL